MNQFNERKLVNKLEFIALTDFPEVSNGDSIEEFIIKMISKIDISVDDGDIFIIAQKIVSKAEGRLRDLKLVQPSIEAKRLSEITGKDERIVELILNESNSVLRAVKNVIIVEHRLGFICANAGIDHSNISINERKTSDFVLLLPENPDKSSNKIRLSLQNKYKKKIGVLIIDSHGRAWRNGTTGFTIGLSGVPGLVDMRGMKDRAGFVLHNTIIAVADELAAGASLIMGEAREGTPVVLVKGFPYGLRESSLNELIRPIENDLFR